MSRLSILITSATLLAALAACSGDRDRAVGQTSFESAPPNAGGGRSGGIDTTDGDSGGAAGVGMPGSVPSVRTVEETDLYRLDGNRLYYLNSYRGLMVFDVTTPDHPRMIG